VANVPMIKSSINFWQSSTISKANAPQDYAGNGSFTKNINCFTGCIKIMENINFF
jgi:hypothetical protein